MAEVDYIHILVRWCHQNQSSSYSDFIKQYPSFSGYITSKLYGSVKNRVIADIQNKIKNIQNDPVEYILSGH